MEAVDGMKRRLRETARVSPTKSLFVDRLQFLHTAGTVLSIITTGLFQRLHTEFKSKD